MTIRAVFFDAVGTVIFPEPSPFVIYAQAASDSGLSLPIEVIRERYIAAFRDEEDRDRQAGGVTSEARERERWRTIVTTALQGTRDPDACFERLWAHYARPEAWRLNADAIRLFAHLATRGIAMGLASNLDSRLRAVVDGLAGLAPLRTRLAISSEVGHRKPSRRFFESLVQMSALTAGEILYVGDDLENDYDGARAAGLHAILLDEDDRHPHVEHRVRSLAELITRGLQPGRP